MLQDSLKNVGKTLPDICLPEESELTPSNKYLNIGQLLHLI